jgi:hypothetical protein
MPAHEPNPERQNLEVGNLLYTLAVIFPSWAGAFLLLYMFRSYGLSALNSYFR